MKTQFLKNQTFPIASILYLSLSICLAGGELFPPQVMAQTSSEGQALPWGSLYEKEPPRPEYEGGSRSGSLAEELCTIAPETLSGEDIRLWSDRPLFLWQGALNKIEVRPYRSEQILWSKSLTDNVRMAAYDGPPLQPGESYNWLVFGDSSNVPVFQISFQILPTEERNKIAAELSRLEAQLQQEGAGPEKIAYAKANYFAEREMWADVLQVAYTVNNPSEALSEFLDSVPQKFCGL